MGHEHIRVFLNHYHKALTADEALPYWKIHPQKKTPTRTKTAKKSTARKQKKRRD